MKTNVKDNLDYLEKGELVSEVANLVKQELKCSEVMFALDPNKSSTSSRYLGDLVIGKKTYSIFGGSDYRNAYIPESVKKEGIKPDQDVRLFGEIVNNKEQIRAVDKFEWIGARTEEYFKDQDYRKAQLFLNKADRCFISRENSCKIEDKLTTKELYQALYDNIPQVLSEFGFIKKGNAYVSTAGYKLDGSCGRKGKVYTYENNLGMLVDYIRGNQTIARFEHIT
ncbi:hypothetical protein MIDIC_140003 [Alphaproteobacteria bacterium]